MEQSRIRVGTRTPEWDKNGNKVGTKWEQESQCGRKLEQNGIKVGTRTPKWDKNENKVGTKWEQEPQSDGNKVGTK